MNSYSRNQIIQRATRETSEFLNVPLLPEQLEDQVNQQNIDQLRQQFSLRFQLFLDAKQLKKDIKQANLESNLTELETLEQNKHRLSTQIQILNNLQALLADPDELKFLRPHQITILKALFQFLETGKTAGYIKSPTGTGKTVMFVKTIQAFLGKHQTSKLPNKKLKVLVVVPRDNLLTQNLDSFKKLAPGLESRIIGAKEKGKKALQKESDVDITTYQKINSDLDLKEKGRREKLEVDPDSYDLVIFDEAHRALGQKTSANMESFLEGKVVIGFSATPDFSEQEGRRLKDLLNELIYSMTVQEAVEAKAISPYQSLVIKTNIDLSAIPIKQGEYDKDALDEKMAKLEGRDQTALELYLGSPNKPEIQAALEERNIQIEGRSAVIYCCGVKHAEKVQAMFNEAGVSAAFVSGKMDKETQQEIITKFKNGEIKVLCNADLLIEGFDAPNAKVCFNLRPVLSHVNAEQRGGRVLRLWNNQSAVIIDIIDQDTRLNPLTFAEVAGSSSTLGQDQKRSTPEQPIGLDEIENEKDQEQEEPSNKPQFATPGSITTENITILLDNHTIMGDANQRLKNQIEQGNIPVGWSNLEKLIKQIANIHSVNYEALLRIANLEKSSGTITERAIIKKTTYIDPKLKDRIIQRIQQKIVPKHWLSHEDAEKLLNINSIELENLIELAKSDKTTIDQELKSGFKEKLTGYNGGFYSREENYLSPTGLEILRDLRNIINDQSAPKDWSRLNHLKVQPDAKILSTVRKHVKHFAPEQIHNFLPSKKSKHTEEYFSPTVQLLLRINQETVPALAKELQTSPEYLNGLILALAKSDLDWIKDNGHIAYTELLDQEIRAFFSKDYQISKDLLNNLPMPSEHVTETEMIEEMNGDQELKQFKDKKSLLEEKAKNIPSLRCKVRNPQNGQLEWAYNLNDYEKLYTRRSTIAKVA